MPCGCPTRWFWSHGSSQILPEQPCASCLGLRAGPQGALGDPSELLQGLSFPCSLQVGLLEVLVEKIFDLAFLPAMNGESYGHASVGGVWLGGPEAAGLLEIFDT